MTLPLELGSVQDAYVRRAFEQLSQAFPVGPGNALGSAPTTTATLPTGTVNGQDFYYRLSGGGVWHFKYDPTSGKWDFAGGPPLVAEVATQEGTASGTFVALTTAGPSVTLPFAGDWDITVGCDLNTAGANYGFMSYDIGGTGAVAADAVEISDVATDFTHAERTRRKTGLTAVTLTAKYAARGNATTDLFKNRVIRAVPVRVG